jgi:hypothetical protein
LLLQAQADAIRALRLFRPHGSGENAGGRAGIQRERVGAEIQSDTITIGQHHNVILLREQLKEALYLSSRQRKQVAHGFSMILQFGRRQHERATDSIGTQAMLSNATFPRYRDAAIRMRAGLQRMTFDRRQNHAFMAIWLH